MQQDCPLRLFPVTLSPLPVSDMLVRAVVVSHALGALLRILVLCSVGRQKIPDLPVLPAPQPPHPCLLMDAPMGPGITCVCCTLAPGSSCPAAICPALPALRLPDLPEQPSLQKLSPEQPCSYHCPEGCSTTTLF